MQGCVAGKLGQHELTLSRFCGPISHTEGVGVGCRPFGALVQVRRFDLRSDHFSKVVVKYFARKVNYFSRGIACVFGVFSEVAVWHATSWLVGDSWGSLWFVINHLNKCLKIFTIAEGWLLRDIGLFVKFSSFFSLNA